MGLASAMGTAAETGRGTIHPPRSLLFGATVAVGASAAALLLPAVGAHIAGYMLGSAVTIALVGLFRRTDLRRRQSAYYAPNRRLQRWGPTLVAAGMVVAAVHTWSIATALAK
jgi:uncharacterized membrane protein YfcA